MKYKTLIFLGETTFLDVIKLHIKFLFKPSPVSKFHLNPVEASPFHCGILIFIMLSLYISADFKVALYCVALEIRYTKGSSLH